MKSSTLSALAAGVTRWTNSSRMMVFIPILFKSLLSPQPTIGTEKGISIRLRGKCEAVNPLGALAHARNTRQSRRRRQDAEPTTLSEVIGPQSQIIHNAKQPWDRLWRRGERAASRQAGPRLRAQMRR